jgi:hypothetical protein
MPSYIGDYEILDTTGMHIQSVAWRGEVLSANFGSGYEASAGVGVSSGLHRFRLSAQTLPDDERDECFIDDQTWFRYYYEFFQRHTTTGTRRQFFVVWDEKYWHVKFVEAEIGFEKFVRSLLYSQGGLELTQIRVSGLTYETDGSIDGAVPCPPMDAEALTLSETEIEVSFADPPEGCVESTATPCPPPIYWATGISESQVLIEFTDAGDDCDGDNLLFVDPSLYYYYA